MEIKAHRFDLLLDRRSTEGVDTRMHCKRHPHYQVRRRPKPRCLKCWSLWLLVSAASKFLGWTLAQPRARKARANKNQPSLFEQTDPQNS